LLGLDAPTTNGVKDAPDVNSAFDYRHEEIDGPSGGLGGEFGQSFSELVWCAWTWSFDDADSSTIWDLTAFVG